MYSNSPDRWFACPQAKPQANIRLFLFPYAGGGPGAFRIWTAELPGHIEVWSAHYPGRGSRHNEPPITDIATLAERFSEAMQAFIDKPFVFFGHSLGGLVAFELARNLSRNHLAPPEMLFISACEAPHLPDPNPPIHELPDLEFLHALRQLNGIPSELSHQPEVMQLLLPILRADFQAVENYVYAAEKSPLGCPIVVFGGLDDPRVSREQLEGWCLHTNSDFRSRYFPGDHFFIHTAREAVVAAIADELISAHAKN